MKCLINIRSGLVLPNRYRDSAAAKMVATGNYGYCPKEQWKTEVRDFKPEPKKSKSKGKKKKKVTS